MTKRVSGQSSERNAGILRRFEKNEPAGTKPTALGMIKRTYENALEYSARARGAGGLIMFFGLIGAAIGIYFGTAVFFAAAARKSLTIIGWVAVLGGAILLIFGVYSAIKSMRLELFRPEDEPTIFDRKNRRVYRLYRETRPGLKGLLSPWPMKRAEYDWDLVDAEHHAILMTTGSTVSRLHSLIFTVKKSHSDPTIVATFPIGNGLQMGELTVPMVWEHIRRFMNEDGPHLPPGEAVRPSEQPTTFWECMAATGPYGRKRFVTWWRNYDLLMIFWVVFFPVAIPVLTLIGIFRWLAVKTAVPVAWDADVMAAVETPARG